MTRPFFFLDDFALMILPTLQWAARIFVFAAASFLPTTFGTRHAGGVTFWLKFPTTALLPFIVTWQVEAMPEQSPFHPPKVVFDVLWLSASVTIVPAGY